MKPFHVIPFIIVWFCCCSTDKENTIAIAMTKKMAMQQQNTGVAEVTNVTVSGDENSYTLSVTLKSPDTGCNQYADWWEVFDLDGNLIYRRILTHSHTNEQPFTRTGGPVEIAADLEIYVRAHMNNSGYSNKVFRGSVTKGFLAEDLEIEFAKDLETEEPLPTGCDF